MIKPILPFRAVVPGSAYPADFTIDDEFEANSVAAKAALDLGCLSDDDAAVVREALALGEDQSSEANDAEATAEAEPKAKAEAKAKGAAPENKAGKG